MSHHTPPYAVVMMTVPSPTQINTFSAELSRDPAHDNHGMIINLKGTKPSDLAVPVHVAFTVEGDGFWNVVNASFGQLAVEKARYVFDVL